MAVESTVCCFTFQLRAFDMYLPRCSLLSPWQQCSHSHVCLSNADCTIFVFLIDSRADVEKGFE